MAPSDAYSIISAAMVRMSSLYGLPLFNEWVIVRLGADTATVLHYEGPRLAECLSVFGKDVAQLRTEASDRAHAPGDFDFARSATGTQFDAMLKIADDAYLLCNNTELSMMQIRAKPEWLKAQVPFVNLSERFRLNPVKFD
jgi:hypothetical protein